MDVKSNSKLPLIISPLIIPVDASNETSSPYIDFLYVNCPDSIVRVNAPPVCGTSENTSIEADTFPLGISLKTTSETDFLFFTTSTTRVHLTFWSSGKVPTMITSQGPSGVLYFLSLISYTQTEISLDWSSSLYEGISQYIGLPLASMISTSI